MQLVRFRRDLSGVYLYYCGHPLSVMLGSHSLVHVAGSTEELTYEYDGHTLHWDKECPYY